jgi:formyltetrahydrofolate-dependent phosphoribosylglycinamide formyltransferase
MSQRDRPVAILISGRGTNMARLIEAAAEPDYPARIAAVIADVADAPGLSFASSLRIRAAPVPRADFATREEHEQAVESELAAAGAEIVCLAGYMRMLSAGFAGRWAGRMINIHPSLLPSFKGLDTHRRALEAGVRIHGCSVHFVTSEMDGGPIIAQAAVPVRIGDDEERLAARVLKAEHRLYPLALKLVAEDRARLENGRTVFEVGDVPEREARRSLIVPEFEEAARSIEDLARFTP